jgi:hypothetical protein
MSSVYLSKMFCWRIAKVIAVSIVLLGVLVACFRCLTQVQIDNVSIDDSSEWSKHFLLISGFSTIKICSHVSSRHYVDYISIVGNNRPHTWFEELGFENVYECRDPMHTITKTLPNEGIPQQVMVMTHPKLPHKIFCYLTTSGVLIYQTI